MLRNPRSALPEGKETRVEIGSRCLIFEVRRITGVRIGRQKSRDRNYGGVAQLGEHLLCKQGVIGSIPFISTKAERLDKGS